MAENADYNFYYKSWPTQLEQKGAIVLVHGMGEHCERYEEMAGVLNQAGYSVFSMDLPGHGQSSGKRGHINRFSDYSSAVLGLYEKVKTEHPDSPIHLLGHSMGGLIAAQVLLDHQNLFSSAMLSAAAIESPQAPAATELAMVNFMSRLLPKMPVMSLDASCISRDQQVVSTYMNDPLVNKGKLTSRMLSELMGAMQDIKQRAAAISLPLLIMHGSGDVMTAPSGSVFMHQTVSSDDKKLTVYDELFHEIFNEPERHTVYADVVTWLDAHS